MVNNVKFFQKGFEEALSFSRTRVGFTRFKSSSKNVALFLLNPAYLGIPHSFRFIANKEMHDTNVYFLAENKRFEITDKEVFDTGHSVVYTGIINLENNGSGYLYIEIGAGNDDLEIGEFSIEPIFPVQKQIAYYSAYPLKECKSKISDLKKFGDYAWALKNANSITHSFQPETIQQRLQITCQNFPNPSQNYQPVAWAFYVGSRQVKLNFYAWAGSEKIPVLTGLEIANNVCTGLKVERSGEIIIIDGCLQSQVTDERNAGILLDGSKTKVVDFDLLIEV